MIYLLLAVLSSASLSIIMRLSEKEINNNIGLLAVNYIICFILSMMDTGFDQLFYITEGSLFVFLFGLFNGFLYLASFVLMQSSIKKNGVILTSLFNKLGILIPMIMSIFLFYEIPTIIQVIGFMIALLAIINMNYEKGLKIKYGLLVLLITAGITDSMSKIFEQVGNQALSSQFLMYTFMSAMILCITYMLFKNQRITKNEMKYGICIGIPNYFSAKFILLSLQHISAVIVYPTYSVGTIITITLTGMLLFKEKLNKKQFISMIGIMIALILLNL